MHQTADGVLGPSGVAPAERARGGRGVGHRDRPEPMGRHRRIRRHGHAHPVGHVAGPSDAGRVADVPVAGSLAEVAADELLTRAADLPDDIARVELEVWVQAHGDEAAALLVEALPGADETGRVIAFRALLDVGPSAAEAMARLAGDPELNAYALIWRVKTGLAGEEVLDAGGDPERLIRTLSALLALWGPEVMPSWLDTVAGALRCLCCSRGDLACAPARDGRGPGHARFVPSAQGRGQGGPPVALQVPLQRRLAGLTWFATVSGACRPGVPCSPTLEDDFDVGLDACSRLTPINPRHEEIVVVGVTVTNGGHDRQRHRLRSRDSGPLRSDPPAAAPAARHASRSRWPVGWAGGKQLRGSPRQARPRTLRRLRHGTPRLGPADGL